VATYTRTDLRDSVLRELGVLDAVEAAEAEDAVMADERCQQQLEALYDDGLIPFDLDSDAIPARYFIPLVRVIAEALILPYGQQSRAELMLRNAEQGMRALRRLKAQPHYGAPQQADYF
jgi:hypothetical protein